MSTQETTMIDPRSPLASTALTLEAARSTLAVLKEETTKATAEFNAAHGEKFKLVKAAADNVLAIEESLRALILDAHRQTKSKEPLPGLCVREETNVSYDKAQVEAMCREKGMCLTVDFAAFEKMAVASPSTFPMVTVRKEPKATIAKDLTETVAAVKAAETTATVGEVA